MVIGGSCQRCEYDQAPCALAATVPGRGVGFPAEHYGGTFTHRTTAKGAA